MNVSEKNEQAFGLVLDEISNMWKKESALQFPQYPPCNLGEYVGVDIILKERVYNIYISEYKQRLSCMFCLDRKDKKNSTIPLKKTMDQADFDTLKSVVNDYLTRSEKEVWSTVNGYYVLFEKEQYEDAFLFYLEIVKSFKSTCV